MNDRLRRIVAERSDGRCEYCQVPLAYEFCEPEVDHIRPLFHRGPTVESNLCYACLPCNLDKGTNIAGYDPVTEQLTRLFHPRLDVWLTHFFLDDATGRLLGLDAIGRTTAEVLRLNIPDRLDFRRLLLFEGVWHGR